MWRSDIMADELDQQQKIDNKLRKNRTKKRESVSSKHHAPFSTEHRKDRRKTGGKRNGKNKSI